MKLRGFALCSALALVCALPAGATDRWETTFFNLTDDSNATPNVLRHGLPQIGHDLEGDPDQDWMMIRVKDVHSYEARVSSATVYWDPACGNPECPRFDRVSSAGAVLTAGVVSSDDAGGFDFGPGMGLVSSGLTVRWISSADGKEFLRALGDQSGTMPAGLTYDVEFYDTTYFIPRFNNSASQVTSLIVQNTTNAAVSGFLWFFSPGGTALHNQPFSVPQNGVLVFNTSSVPALQGQSGSARIVHTGGYGSLAGKAVALEPSTGFTFDTQLEPIPR
jgi:hypothetical protein